MSVDLPEPDGPMIAANWPRGIVDGHAAKGVDGRLARAIAARDVGGGDRGGAGGGAVEERGALGRGLQHGWWSFRDGVQAATATEPNSASRAIRETAWRSAPAASRASAAWAIRRPVKPREPATATEAVTSLPAGAGESS